jgi:hypothetical protein
MLVAQIAQDLNEIRFTELGSSTGAGDLLCKSENLFSFVHISSVEIV